MNYWIQAQVQTPRPILSKEVSCTAPAMSGDSIQCGLTKFFLRKTAHDLLEGRRSRRMREAACRLQCWYRTSLARQRFLTIIGAIRLIQRICRGMLARRRAAGLRLHHAVLRVQTIWRSAFAAKRYRSFYRAVVILQSASRRITAKKIAASLSKVRNTIRLQRIVRGSIARIQWRRLRRCIIGKL